MAHLREGKVLGAWLIAVMIDIECYLTIVYRYMQNGTINKHIDDPAADAAN